MHHSLYIEFIGSAGVGKTVLRDRLALALGEYDVGLPSKSYRHHVRNILRHHERRLALAKLAGYFHRDRGMRMREALRIATFIAMTPAALRPEPGRNRALLVDEGPVVYLLNRGGAGPGWERYAPLLQPDHPGVRSAFVFLRASDQVLKARRAERRARGISERNLAKAAPVREGKSQTSEADRRIGQQFWFETLVSSGASCLMLDTDGKSPDALLAELQAFLSTRM